MVFWSSFRYCLFLKIKAYRVHSRDSAISQYSLFIQVAFLFKERISWFLQKDFLHFITQFVAWRIPKALQKTSSFSELGTQNVSCYTSAPPLCLISSLFSFLFENKDSLNCPGWPGTHSVAQTVSELAILLPLYLK